MPQHDEWLRQIDAELDGELTLAEQAALARHLTACSHCAGARVSHLDMRVAFAQSAGEPQARVVPRPAIRGRFVTAWAAAALAAGLSLGWAMHAQFGRPGSGTVDGVRAAIIVR